MSNSFRVFLVFGIAVSCLTSLGNASVLEPTLNWDAAEDSSGQYWDSKFNGAGLNQHNNRRWDFGAGNGAADDASGSNFGAITKSYDDKAKMRDFQSNGLSPDPTKQNATFELVFRPDDFSDKHYIFETGGEHDGTAIWLDGDQLTLRVQNLSATGDPQKTITTTLDTAGIFYDILFTIGVSTDEIRLYVNGSLMASGGFSGDGNLKDWAGGDDSGLSNIGGGGVAGGSGGDFQGDVAIMRYYRNDILDQSEIDGNFAAMQAIPEPSSIAMWSALGIIGLVVARRKRKLTRAA